MDEFVTTREYADMYGVSQRTVQRWIAQGLIFAVKIGRSLQIPIDEPIPSTLQEQVISPTEEVDDEDEELILDIEGTEPEDDPEPSQEDEDFSPEEVDDEDTDDFGIETRLASSIDHTALRAMFSELADAQEYASEIPVPTLVFRRAEDGFYQIEVLY